MQETRVDLLIDEPHILADNDFNIVIGASQPIPEDIGRWRAKRLYKTIDEIFVGIEQELKTSDCKHIGPKITEFWYKRAPKEVVDGQISSTQT